RGGRDGQRHGRVAVREGGGGEGVVQPPQGAVEGDRERVRRRVRDGDDAGRVDGAGRRQVDRREHPQGVLDGRPQGGVGDRGVDRDERGGLGGPVDRVGEQQVGPVRPGR